MNSVEKLICGLLAAVGILMIPADSISKKVTTRVNPPATEKVSAKAKQKTYPRQKEEFTDVSRSLVFLGYDKKTNSSKETFFVENRSEVSLKEIELEISYFNAAGKLIHKRKVEIEQEFPAGETRSADIPSWDTQKSFHYAKSTASKNGSTPYTVRFKVLSFIKSSE